MGEKSAVEAIFGEENQTKPVVMELKNYLKLLLILLLPLQLFSQTGDQYANVQFTNNLTNGDGKISVYVFVENEYDGHWDYLRGLDIDVSVDGGPWQQFGFLGLQKQSRFHGNINKLLFDLNSYKDVYKNNSTEYQLKTHSEGSNYIRLYFTNQDGEVGDYVVPRHFEDTNSQVNGTAGGADRVQIDIYPHHIERFKNARTIQFRTRGEYLENFFQFDDWDHYPSDRKKTISEKFTAVFDIGRDLEPKDAVEEAGVTYTDNNIRSANGDLTIGVDLEYFDNHTTIKPNDFDHLQYIDIDYSEDNGKTWKGFGYVRYKGYNESYDPWSKKIELYDNAKNKQDYNLYFANTDNEVGSLVTYRVFDASREVVSGLTNKSNRLEVKIPISRIPRLKELNSIKWRVRGQYYDGYNGVTKIVSLPDQLSNNFKVKEEDDSGQDEIGFETSFNESEGSVNVVFRLTKNKDEVFYDHIACLEMGKRVKDANGNVISDELIGFVYHKAGILGCSDKFEPAVSSDFKDKFGDTYRFGLKYNTQMATKYGDNYWTESDGNTFFVLRDYIDQKDYGKKVDYYVAGSYFVRDIDENKKVPFYWYNNRSAEINLKDKMPMPNMAIKEVKISSTSDCQIDLNWDAPNLDNVKGELDNYYISILRNGVEIGKVDADGGVNEYSDKSITAGENYNYAIRLGYDRKFGSTDFPDIYGRKSAGKSAMIALLEAPAGLSSTQVGCDGDIEIKWSYSGNPANFRLERQKPGEEFKVLKGDINGSLRSYVDKDVTKGEVYKYRIAAIAGSNKCSALGKYSPVYTHSKDPQDITPIFDHKEFVIEASKGYFNNRTELEWKPNLDTEQYINQYKIYAREFGSTLTPKLLTTLNVNAKRYDHVDGNAGTIYEYFIIGERVLEDPNCGRQITSSFAIESLKGIITPENLSNGVGYDVGLRVATGVVNGNITYKGGTAVPNVKVVAERQDANRGKSLLFNGTDAYAEIPYSDKISPSEAITFSLWIKPEVLEKFSVIAERQVAYGIHLSQDGEAVFYIKDQDSDYHEAKTPAGTITQGNWVNITGTFDAKTKDIKIYINGKKIASKNIPIAKSIFNGHHQFPLTIGRQHSSKNYYFQGNIDEIRLYNRAMTEEEVQRNYSKFIATDHNGIQGYWKIFEGLGSNIYDLAHKGDEFFKNNGKLHNTIFKTDAPTPTQLGNVGYTDTYGNYTIEAIEYSGTGENFNIIPTATLAGAVHEFDPSRKTIFIGEGSVVNNGTDFEDVSSFKFSGFVRYDFEDTVGSNIKTSGSKGIRLYLDGVTAISGADNKVFETDENGFFEVQVPIGHHFIEFRKNGHTFKNGRYPAENTHDFQEGVTGLKIYDQTTHILSGRIVGGAIEAAKPLFMPNNPSVNNIGRAKFTITSEDGKIVREVTTTSNTGEFTIKLPPKKYTSGSVKWIKDNVNIVESGNITPIDLASITAYNGKHETDSVFVNKKFSKIDSTFYNLRRDFIYRSKPQLVVTDTLGKSIKEGAEQRYNLKQGTKAVTIDLSTLKYPTYFSASDYAYKMKAVEKYTNKDTNAETTVPVSDGKITVNNGIGVGFYKEGKKNKSYGTPEKIDLNNKGELIYLFKTQEPNINENNTVGKEHLSYTQQISITLEVGDETTYWPNPSDGNVTQRAYVIGGKQQGANFVTKAPPVVDFVLRDPPGSNSYAYFSKEKKVFTTAEFSAGGFFNFNHFIGAGVGMNTLVGGGIAGVGEVAEGKILGTLEFNLGFDIGVGGEYTYEASFSENIETNDEPIQVGRSDIFVAKSQNMMTGMGVHIRPVPIELCGGNCYGDVMTDTNGKQYKMTRVFQSYLNPVGKPTFFIYSQNHIENVLIPDLIQIRNSFFTKVNSPYKSKLKPNHVNYGTNNDDPVWGASATTTNSIRTELKDFNGSSYTYTPAGDINTAIDSVRVMNQQIRLWKEALANNEIQKWIAKKYRKGENVSIASGVKLERSSTTSHSGSAYVSFEMQSSIAIGAKAEFDGYGVAAETEISAEIGLRLGAKSTTGGGQSKTVGYVLHDADEDDAISVDIFGGTGSNGPIFLTKAGQTSCPFEDKIVMKYATKHYIQTLIDIQEGIRNKAEEEAKAFGIAGATDEETKKYGQVNQLKVDIDQLKALLVEVNKGEVVLSNATLQRDKPKLKINGAKTAQAFNVPADEAASFELTLINAGEAGDPQNFAIQALDETNPNGLEMTIDGQSINSSRNFLVKGNGSIQKLLKVRRGPNEYNYENVGIIIKSTCQADPTGNDAVLADTIHFNVKYLPICTNLKIISPTDKWTVNNSFNNKLPITIGDYDVNKVGFEEIKIQYKTSNSADWTLLTTYYRNAEIRTKNGGSADAPLLPTTGNSFTYQWDLGKLPDGNYDIRAISTCALAENTTEIFSGIIDRTNPVPFGLPQPSDGILSPGEEPSVQFNETINEGLLSPANFDIRGVLNGGVIRHSASVAFEGKANSYVEVEEFAVVDKPFTIEFYAKREKDNTTQILIGQGTKEAEELLIGFNASNQFFFKLGGETVTGTTAIDNNWHHYAVTYDPLHKDLTLYYDAKQEKIDNSFEVDVKLTSSLFMGKSPRVSENYFIGKMHEVRVWSRPLTVGQINIFSTKKLVGNEAGLLYNWQMEEANGTLALDKVRGKHAKMNATWSVTPLGYALELKGVKDQANTIPVTFDNTTDFTIEFWFKSAGGTDEVLLSNGKGDGVDVNASGWSIGIDTDGKPYAQSNGQKMKGKTLVNDSKWYHLAVVTNARGNAVLYINGEEQEKIAASTLKGFGGSALWIGQQGWYEGTLKKTAKYFTGNIDELRIWDAAVTVAQLSRDRYNMLTGNEPGLVRYYSFETYTETSGVTNVTATSANKIVGAKANETITLGGGAQLNQDTPTIKLQRPVEFVNFSYAVNNDKIIITLNVEPAKIENVQLDFTVKNVKDVNGNSIQSPIKWSAFVDRNQVIWQDDRFNLETAHQKELVFESKVVNNSGESKTFSISNIPHWLEVTPTSGTVGPLTTVPIQFKVTKDVNIGNYSEDILLSTSDFGFAEKLNVNVKVKKALPDDWKIDPNDFEYSMNVIGQIAINGVVSRDEGNILGVFVDNECRGMANLKYVKSYDNYQAFLTIYSNVSSGEKMEFRIWEHQTGIVHSALDHNLPNNVFTADTYHGTAANPKLFSTTNIISGSIDVVNGWRWIAFNLNGSDLSSTNKVLNNLEPINGDIIKTRVNTPNGSGGFVQESLFDTYSAATKTWSGSLSNKGALHTGVLYKVNVSKVGKVKYEGAISNPLTSPIHLVSGWNYIGYLGLHNIPINEALSNFNATPGDLIKSQYYSAIYDSSHGWIGTLKVLSPNEGYMIRATTAQSFKYPSYNSAARGTTPNGGITKVTNVKAETPWTISAQDYENNMSIIAVIEDSEKDKHNGVLGAFVDGVCKGYAAPVYYEDLDKNVYFINVGHRDSAANITFKYIDLTHQILYDVIETSTYQIDQIEGNLSTPKRLTLTGGEVIGGTTITVFPNPAKEKMFVSIPLSQTSKVMLQLFDKSGRRLFIRQPEEIQKGQHTFAINANELSSGMYHLVITINDKVTHRKVMVTK